MPSLQVRELPEHIYLSLCRQAEAQHRSIAQQAVSAIARGLSLELDPRLRRKAILDSINAAVAKCDVPGLPDPVLLIREDRDR
jgi:hypothetical protein